MASRKRKNGKSKSQDVGRQYQDPETTKGKEIIDEKLVKDGAVKWATVDNFSEAGYACAHCSWTTSKKGNSGIQALRAHSKVHVRDRRARVNTLIIQWLVLATAIVIALSPEIVKFILMVGVGETRAHLPIDVELMIATMVSAAVLLTISIQLTGDLYIITGKRHWWAKYTWSVRLLVMMMWSAAGLRWLDVWQDIWLLWLIPVLVSWATWVHVGVEAASTRLAVKRRTFKPPNRRKLLKSKTKRTDQKISILRRSAKLSIRNGTVILDKLSKKRRDFYDRLGVGNTRLDRRSQQWRLAKDEDVRRKIEQRNLRFRRSQDRRKRRGDT